MKRVYLIDGYNVVNASPRYAALAEQDIEIARARLVDDVEEFVHGSGEGIVVFDGADNPGSDGSVHGVGNAMVVFSPYGHDADEVIEDLVARHRRSGDDVVVVTSDAETQWVALGFGATRMSSAEFVRTMLAETEDHRLHGVQRHVHRVTVESRLDESTRDKLRRWARGEK